VENRGESLRLLVAAGGTGGHLYPALAVAREFLDREPEAHVIFSGTRRGLESRIVPKAGFRLEMVRVEPLRGGGVSRKIKGALSLFPAFIDAVRLLRRTRPRVVMGVGGYVAGPVLAVAGLAGVPTLIVEPNATPGLANRWLSRLVDAAALAWEDTKRYFGAKGFVSGNPVRAEIARVGPRPAGRDLRLLVFGGSQGSRVLNRVMVDVLPHLRSYQDRIRITHQTGEADVDRVRAAYQREECPARVEPYLEAMDREYQECDLVISRAGATTCAELAAAGRPAILVPLPLAGGHQRNNAEMMERRGAALMILQEELSGDRLAGTVLDLLDAPERREEMARSARSLARPDAAKVIVDRLLGLAGRGREGSRR
jgi:UDP-N-acetylglucosamine--N-acetylmuramyl-(pentapeptide) pyrophosphoryl-undecaprenol N-acetylglucosamine transferase